VSVFCPEGEKMEEKMKRAQTVAAIRNKVTLSKTILENLAADKKVSKELIGIALKDLAVALKLIGEEQP